MGAIGGYDKGGHPTIIRFRRNAIFLNLCIEAVYDARYPHRKLLFWLAERIGASWYVRKQERLLYNAATALWSKSSQPDDLPTSSWVAAGFPVRHGQVLL
jgi:hypothetical protein